MDCIGFTTSQTDQCFCRICFSYKCRKCKQKLPILPVGKYYSDRERPICFQCQDTSGNGNKDYCDVYK